MQHSQPSQCHPLMVAALSRGGFFLDLSRRAGGGRRALLDAPRRAPSGPWPLLRFRCGPSGDARLAGRVLQDAFAVHPPLPGEAVGFEAGKEDRHA